MRNFINIVENVGYDALGFITRHGGRTVSYDELPEPARKAVYQYMQVDGENDEYDEQTYGYAEAPAEAVIDFINHYMSTEHGATPEDLNWSTGKLTFRPSYPVESVWPVLISNSGFDDGTHRLERYVKLGLTTIPVVAILPNR